MEVTFTEKQTKAVLFMIAEVLQDTDDNDVLDELAQTAVGAYLDTCLMTNSLIMEFSG